MENNDNQGIPNFPGTNLNNLLVKINVWLAQDLIFIMYTCRRSFKIILCDSQYYYDIFVKSSL